MRKLLAFPLALVMFAACGDNESNMNQDVTVNPPKPTGSVVGTVVDSYMQPLAGAKVSASYGTKVRTATTDANGHFAFTKVPAGGPVGLTVAAEGFSTAHLATTIPSAAGESPVDGTSVSVGPISLWPMDGEITINLIGSDGTVIDPKGAFCNVDASWVDWTVAAGTGGGILDAILGLMDEGVALKGPVMVDAETAPGKVTCSGLPRLQDMARAEMDIQVWIPAVDVDGDGLADFAGFFEEIDVKEYMTEGVTWVVEPLSAHNTTASVVASNVGTLAGLGGITKAIVEPTETLDFVFDVPVVVHLSSILSDDEKPESIGHTVSVSGNRLEIKSEGGPWEKGQKFSLRLVIAPESNPMSLSTLNGVFLVSTDEDLAISRVFFVDDNTNDDLDLGETIEIVLSQVVGRAGLGGTARLYFQVNEDIDGGGDVGDHPGEVGHDEYFEAPLVNASQGFTRFARLTWTEDSIPAGTQLRLFFLPEEELMLNTSGKVLDVTLNRSITAVEP